MCVVLAFSSCKSSESAYKKAYEKAKQQELAETPAAEVVPAENITPVERTVVTTTTTNTTATANANKPVKAVDVTPEKVTVVSGNGGLMDYSVVAGSFAAKANAEGLKDYLDKEGYSAVVAYNAEINMYRVIVCTYPDRASAADARDSFKAKYPQRKDFQGAWLLYRIQ